MEEGKESGMVREGGRGRLYLDGRNNANHDVLGA
jgi:hypothetical protein